jgi:hypothetical protein
VRLHLVEDIETLGPIQQLLANAMKEDKEGHGKSAMGLLGRYLSTVYLNASSQASEKNAYRLPVILPKVATHYNRKTVLTINKHDEYVTFGDIKLPAEDDGSATGGAGDDTSEYLPDAVSELRDSEDDSSVFVVPTPVIAATKRTRSTKESKANSNNAREVATATTTTTIAARGTVAKKSSVKKSSAKRSGARKPVATKLVDESPVVAEKPIAKRPVAEKSVARKPVVDNPVTKKTIAEEPAAKKPVAQKSITNRLIVDVPVATKPIAKKVSIPRRPLGSVDTNLTPSSIIRMEEVEEVTPNTKFIDDDDDGDEDDYDYEGDSSTGLFTAECDDGTSTFDDISSLNSAFDSEGEEFDESGEYLERKSHQRTDRKRKRDLDSNYEKIGISSFASASILPAEEVKEVSSATHRSKQRKLSATTLPPPAAGNVLGGFETPLPSSLLPHSSSTTTLATSGHHHLPLPPPIPTIPHALRCVNRSPRPLPRALEHAKSPTVVEATATWNLPVTSPLDFGTPFTLNGRPRIPPPKANAFGRVTRIPTPRPRLPPLPPSPD